MRVAVFSTKEYDKKFLDAANHDGHELIYHEPRLTIETAKLAVGYPAVCVFVNDQLTSETLAVLNDGGTRLIVLRSAGFNHVNLVAAEQLGLIVARVPEYSPHAIAEHTAGLILSLNRRTYRAYNRVKEANFSLEGLLGFNLNEKTVGIIGTGRIGLAFAKIMNGFGCRILAHDPYPAADAPSYVKYVNLHDLYREADIVSLHCPLTPQTYHLIGRKAIASMKTGVMLINTSRGSVVDTRALLEGLKSKQIGFLGLDVYEEEENLFFRNLSDQVIEDDVFMRLTTFPNVLITGHQGFFTIEALQNIASATLANLTAFEKGSGQLHLVTGKKIV